MFTKPDATGTVFPRLKGKAHESRHLLPILLEILEDPLTQVEDPRFPGYVAHRMSCVTYLCRFYGICDAPTPFLTPEASKAAEKCIKGFLHSYEWLTDWAITNRVLRWQLTIKFHLFLHQVFFIRYLNPKFGSCYTPESWLGSVAKITHSSSYGKPSYAWGCFLMRRLQMVALVAKRRSYKTNPKWFVIYMIGLTKKKYIYMFIYTQLYTGDNQLLLGLLSGVSLPFMIE